MEVKKSLLIRTLNSRWNISFSVQVQFTFWFCWLISLLFPLFQPVWCGFLKFFGCLSCSIAASAVFCQVAYFALWLLPVQRSGCSFAAGLVCAALACNSMIVYLNVHFVWLFFCWGGGGERSLFVNLQLFKASIFVGRTVFLWFLSK